MKKVLMISGILVVCFIAALIAVPFLFKGQIVELIKTEANKNINAALDFDDVGLSLIKNFPELTLTIENLRIINEQPFEGDTLLSLSEFQATLDLMSLFGEQVQVVSIRLIKPHIWARVLEDGRANWDIVPETEVDTVEKEAPSTYSLAVKEYTIEDAYLSFRDDSTNIYAEIDGLNHHGAGDFSQTLFTLFTKTSIENLIVKMGDVPYLSGASLDIKADLEMDMENMKFSFVENEIRLNNLGLNFDGSAGLINEQDFEIDLTFNAKQAEFKDILSMVPYIYQQNFAELKAEGQLGLSGAIKGVYTSESVPAFDINLNINNGMFQYPDLPTSVDNMQVDLEISNPGKTLDHTVVNLKKFHLEILNEPMDAHLTVKTPISDPYIDAYFRGSLNLKEVQNIFPMEEKIELKGLINTDIRFKGNMSSLEKQQADKIIAEGSVILSNIEYGASDLPMKVKIPSGRLDFSPQKATLKNLKVLLGESDITANGSLDNIFGYVMSGQTVKGQLSLKSQYFDINPWMTEEDTSSLDAVELPDKVDFELTADFKKVTFDSLKLSDTKGNLHLKEQTLKMIDLKSNLLNGSMVTNGSYSFIPPANPHISFDLKFTNFSIPGMYKTFVTVQKLAPMAKYMKGDINGDIVLHSDLGDSLMPVWETLNSKGQLHIPRASIENFEPLNKVADKLKIKELKNPTLVDFNPKFEIKNGRFYVEPTTLTLDKYTMTLSGSNGMDKSLDYVLNTELPASDVSKLVNRDVSLLTGETFDVDVLVKGTITSPEVDVDLDKLAKDISGHLKEAAKKEAEKQKAELEKKAKEELEKKKKAEEEKLKKELEKKVKEGKEKAKDKLKDLFGK